MLWPEHTAALLMLADGRFPAGGYAHSGGLEPAIGSGDVVTVADLESLLVGRLHTVGLVAAAFAAAACRRTSAAGAAVPDELWDLDAELDARTPSPAQRDTSRQLGRQLVRAVSAIAPSTSLVHLGRTPHHPIALGAAAAQLGLGPQETAFVCLHEGAAGPVAAAARLLSTDPYATHGVLARLGPLIEELAEQAAVTSLEITGLPAMTCPLLETNAERHVTRTSRLFAS